MTFIVSQYKAQCTFTANISSNASTNICGPDSITLTAEPIGDTWTRKIDFFGVGRYEATGFSIGNKGYIGTGHDDNYTYLNDFWEYDQATDSWTQIANIGGGNRTGAVGFSIANKGYVGTGAGAKDFWEYDPLTNTWTQKANFGGLGRTDAFGFSIGNKGYIGGGETYSNYFNDFWEYNPATNLWTQKAPFFVARSKAIAFSIGGKGYAGIGTSFGAGPQYEFCVYNPVNNTWSGINFPGQVRENAFAFAIGGKGYVGGGMYYNFGLHDFWEFDPITNGWTQKTDNGYTYISSVGLAIGNKGYVGTGVNPNTLQAFWEYDQSYNHVWSNGVTTPTINVHTAGTYSVNVTDMTGCSSSALQTVSVNVATTVVATSSSPSICAGSSVVLSASGADSYVWNGSMNSASISVSPSVTTSYTVEGFSSNGCSDISIVTQSVSTCIGLHELNENDIQIKVYPNPTPNTLSIETTTSVDLTILNALGKVVYTATLKSGINQIDISAFSDGLYLMKLNNQSLIENVKLVKSSLIQ